jgi:molecular chaperone GrpE
VPTAEARLAALEDELAAKSAELAAFKDSAQRQLAEMLNQRRRAENDSAEARKYGASSFAREVLGVADNLKRALAAAKGADGAAGDVAARAQKLDGLVQGVELIDREFATILDRHGIKLVDPKGEKFDPHFHQAMFEVETADAEPGTVVQVVQAGYRLQDRLLRPAMVGVAKAPSKDAPADANGGEEPAL